jgi:hypothetical protein
MKYQIHPAVMLLVLFVVIALLGSAVSIRYARQRPIPGWAGAAPALHDSVARELQRGHFCKGN